MPLKLRIVNFEVYSIQHLFNVYFPCQAAPPEQHGRFYVNELVCGLFAEDQQWYRAIVLDVGNSHDSCLDSLDPYVTSLLCNPDCSVFTVEYLLLVF